MMLFVRLAWRNIWRHRSRTVIVVLAISVSLMLMTVFQGYVTGIDDAMYGNAIKFLGGNIHVHAPGYAEESSDMPMLPVNDAQAVVEVALRDPRVQAATRRINTGGIVSSRQGTFAVGIVGVEPEAELPVNVVGQHITQGRNLSADDGDAILIGRGLAELAEVEVGDRLALVGRATHNQMRQRTMTVVGIFDLGMASIEKDVLYVSLAEAGRLYLEPGQATEVVIWPLELGNEDAMIEELSAALPGYEIASWREKHPALQQIMAIWDVEVEVVGLTMLGITAIGTLNLMLMAVYERTREIGVLAALGLKPRQISRLFLLEGTMMGILGGIIGLAVGVGINLALGGIGYDLSAYIDMMESFALMGDVVYPGTGLDDALLHVLMAVGVSVVASLYPARQAARREPAEALHYV